MELPITYEMANESGIPKLKELLKDIASNPEPVPEECKTPDVQAQCNKLIRTYFTDRKAPITPK